MVASLETVKENCPSKSVITPLVVPFSRTLAPITGSELVSKTTPVIFMSWATAIVHQNIKNNKLNNFVFFIILN